MGTTHQYHTGLKEVDNSSMGTHGRLKEVDNSSMGTRRQVEGG